MTHSPVSPEHSSIQIYSTLSARKEAFLPLEKDKVKMYVCGVTPYDEPHLGHARCYVFFDTIRRFFKAVGFEVTYIQNFTDIDDKIIARAKTSNLSASDLSQRHIADYFREMALLNVQEANAYPRVTEFVPQIVQFIQRLVDSGFAYSVNGNVFYSVRKCAGYGKLSKRALDEMEAGARVEIDESKKDPLDFALWKKALEGDPSWDSPWGPGRPGWHIECSVMSMQYLGETFDIHGGGQDLIFPHHENEIAQSESASGKPFVRYWLHNGFVTVNREKMSKSLGNFFTLREIFQKYPPEVVRLFLLSRHYRTPLDFSDDLLQQSRNSLYSLEDTVEICSFLLEDGEEKTGSIPLLDEWVREFVKMMCDDLNSEKALAVVFQLRNQMTDKIAQRDLDWLRKGKKTLNYLCGDLLGISLKPKLSFATIRELKIKLEKRERYRKEKDWKNADIVRKDIEAAGYIIEDTSHGAVVKSSHSVCE